MADQNTDARPINSATGDSHGLARRLGLFDATMIVMGGIVGSGIFVNPYVVARQVHTPFLILGAWLAGGAVALAGAFVYAELAARRPQVGGQYAYLRDAFHPSVAFLYGWALLLVIQTGGMAAVAVTFARYFVELTRVQMPDWAVAAATLALLSVVNCLGVRAGSNVQSVLMVLKIAAIVALVVCGLFFVSEPHALAAGRALDRPVSLDLLTGMGAALTPVMFAYRGWQPASSVAGAMAEDGVFFRAVARLDARTRAPVVAIALQGALAAVIAMSGRYEQILNYVVSVDFIWFGLTAASLFVFRRHARALYVDESNAAV